MEESWFAGLPVKIIGRHIRCFKKVTSTNDLAWLEISRNAPEGTGVFANEQFKGRGRFGRKWHSPTEKGLWVSIILKPDLPVEKTPFIMVIGAIAICQLIKQEFDLSTSIRWPNDVLINEKKVAGIIVESRIFANQPKAMVLGIGFNVNLSFEEIPADLKSIATSLLIEKNHTIEMRMLTRHLLIYLDNWYEKIVTKDYEPIKIAWREMSGVMNQQVIIKKQDEQIEGLVTELDPCEGISLKMPDGTIRQFQGEQVESLRLK